MPVRSTRRSEMPAGSSDSAGCKIGQRFHEGQTSCLSYLLASVAARLMHTRSLQTGFDVKNIGDRYASIPEVLLTLRMRHEHSKALCLTGRVSSDSWRADTHV